MMRTSAFILAASGTVLAALAGTENGTDSRQRSPRATVEPAPLTTSKVEPSAVPTFHCLGVYWSPEEGGADSPGHDEGLAIPNFCDVFTGNGPDMGADEAGTAPMEFGVKALFVPPGEKDRETEGGLRE